MRIDLAASREIEAAFAAAQARTRAPLACVVAECSADYALAPSLGVAAIALATPWPLLLFTAWPPSRIYLIQLIVFAALLGVLALTPLRAALHSRARRRSACYRAALVQFARAGFDRAGENNGVLLYISLTERYARVIAGSGVDAHIPHAAWRGLIAELGAALRAGEPKNAMQTAARRMGELLGPAFPATPDDGAPIPRRFHML